MVSPLQKSISVRPTSNCLLMMSQSNMWSLIRIGACFGTHACPLESLQLQEFSNVSWKAYYKASPVSWYTLMIYWSPGPQQRSIWKRSNKFSLNWRMQAYELNSRSASLWLPPLNTWVSRSTQTDYTHLSKKWKL